MLQEGRKGSKKRIAVFFTAPGFDDYPFGDPEFRMAYHQLAQMLTDRGAVFAIVRDPATYRGKGVFSKAWVFRDGTFHVVDAPWQADVIFNKARSSSFQPKDVTVVNTPELERLCTDKWETYQRFPDLFPATLLVQNQQELEWAAKQLNGDRIVTKPLDGEGGEGVHIGPAKEILSRDQTFPLLIQDFLDTSDGIPGIAKGMHDLRIFAIRGVPLRCYVRQPKEGSFLANFQQGGSLFEIPVDSVPADAMTLFQTVDAGLKRFKDRVYCVDMGRGKSGRWALIELNSKPGLDPIDSRYPSAEAFMRRLADLLLTV